jgi:hypothetical protein
VISNSGSGSAYSGKSHTLQIRIEGSSSVNGYGATGLPSGMSINTSTGLVSGTPVSTGTFPLVLTASGDGGTGTANYTLVVRDPNSDATNPLDVVINKFHNNGTADVVELLVTARGVPGATVDLRGMVIKDFSSNMDSDLGGRFILSNSTVWQTVKAGTLIVLNMSNSTEDLNASDFLLRVNLSNTQLFRDAYGSFNIGNTEMVMLKAAGTGADGIAGGIHALSTGSRGAQYSNFNGRKLNASQSLTSNRPFAFALNNSSTLPDFYSSSGADFARTLNFGVGSNVKNTTFIQSLRTAANNPPVITLNGANPMTIAHGTIYNEPGAIAFDSEDGTRAVTISGSVNSAVVGNYTITYRASDAGNLTTTVNRSVLVRDQTPPIVTLNGNSTIEIPFGGPFIDPGATAIDAVDGARTVNVSGTVNPFAAGSYILTYTATDAAGNTSPGSTRSVSVAKGIPEISQPPSASPITEGDSLALSTLSGGTASVSGNFVWSEPATTPLAGTGNFSITFVPIDTGNYTIALGHALVTVNPRPSDFDSWASSQGLSGLDAALSSDPDRDGLSNANEFAFGLDPNSAGTQPTDISRDNHGRVKVTYLRRATGVLYVVRLATSLESGFDQTLESNASLNQENLNSTGLIRHEVVLPDTDKAFIKIEATIP